MSKRFKIVIAPDSFKGSISAQDAALAIEKGLKSLAEKDIELITVISPIADGGEGTLDALTTQNERIELEVTSTNKKRILAQYGAVDNTAIIEMARAAGLTLTPESERNASLATTFGVGEMILDALERGYRNILLTVGGSGTNDGGCAKRKATSHQEYCEPHMSSQDSCKTNNISRQQSSKKQQQSRPE